MKYLPYLILAAIPAAIMFPFLGDGYLFLLDMMWAPPQEFARLLNNGIGSGFPLRALLWLLENIIEPDLLQKLVLLGILLLMAFAMFRLARQIMPQWWAVLAGATYLLNPYVYERFLAGHFVVLLGYAFFPLVVLSFIKMTTKPSVRQISSFVLLLTIFPMLSLHWAYIGIWFLLLLAVVTLALRHTWKKVFTSLKTGIALLCGAAVLLGANSFWMLPSSITSQQVTQMDASHFEAFQTLSDPEWGVGFQVLSLYGFWQSEHLLPKDFADHWWVVTFAYLIIAGIGAVIAIRNKNSLGIAALIAFLPATLIAIGYGSMATRPLIDALIYLPGFSGLRETQKVAGLLAFAYALLVPLGASALAGLVEQKLVPQIKPLVQVGLGMFLASLVFTSVTPIFTGFAGQLQPSDYPSSWYEANSILEQANKKALFLPWHGYMPMPFTQMRTVSNPAARFFSVPIVQGRGFKNGSIDGGDNPDWEQHIFSLLNNRELQAADLDFLEQQEIGFIILAKARDWDRYFFLEENPAAFEKVYDSAEIRVWRVEEGE